MTRARFSAVGLRSFERLNLVQEDVLVRLDERTKHSAEVVEVDDPPLVASSFARRTALMRQLCPCRRSPSPGANRS